jgi:hypothetical protein
MCGLRLDCQCDLGLRHTIWLFDSLRNQTLSSRVRCKMVPQRFKADLPGGNSLQPREHKHPDLLVSSVCDDDVPHKMLWCHERANNAEASRLNFSQGRGDPDARQYLLLTSRIDHRVCPGLGNLSLI